ncbi:PepSY domain-containing protein [Candidatus Saccharibacteria bacterium]|nr:PepSY domain-containing protein [Candidatus Saccharibacteria bacterium]
MKKMLIPLVVVLIALATSTTVLAVVLANKSISGQKKVVGQPLPYEQLIETESSITTFPRENDVEGDVIGNYITAHVALNMALDALGVERSAVRDIDVDLEFRAGKAFYEVGFEMGQYEYKYYVDALSGEILKTFRELD